MCVEHIARLFAANHAEGVDTAREVAQERQQQVQTQLAGAALVSEDGQRRYKAGQDPLETEAHVVVVAINAL